MNNLGDVFAQLVIIGVVLSIGYLFPKSKSAFVIESLMLVILLGGYDGNSDLDNYRVRYYNDMISDGILEQLYNRMAAFFHSTGMRFEVFHLLITALAILTFAYIAKKLSPEPALVMSMMVGFATIEYALQIQFLCASAILSYALYFFYSRLLNNKKGKVLIGFLLLIGFAAGFHFVSIFYLLFLLYDFASAKYLKYWVVAALVIMFITAPTVFQTATQYIPALRNYSSYRRNEVIIGMCLWQLSGVWVVTQSYQYLVRHMAQSAEAVSTLQLAQFIYKGSLIVTMTIPFYMWTTVASRIVRVWMIFYFILITLIPRQKGKMNLCRTLMICYNFGTVILFYVILSDPNAYNVTIDVLANNLFW